jgi:hypothetical protein
VSRPQDWWPLSDGDPVPGDPDTLASLGKHMSDAAAEIERMAVMLPKICTSQVWDSDAGTAFRAKAGTTGQSIGKTHHRFITVATALGSSAYGGTGYAAELQEYQDQADAAITAVNGTAGGGGSEQQRRAAWGQLLDATHGADPSQPPAAKGKQGPPAGPMPQASPGNIPPALPAFAADPADVASLKSTYNAAIDQLNTSARAISQAVSNRDTSAGAAAQAIQSAINSDGLKNPSGFLHWLHDGLDDVGHFISSHWVQFVSDLANLASIVATVCGIIALVLAFIPGLEEFAALFETMALLAQAVAFVCHTVLAATGHGSWLDVGIDAVGLLTFGMGKGLIGGAEAAQDVAEITGDAYQAAGATDTIEGVVKAGDAAVTAFGENAAKISMTAKLMENLKDVVSVKPVFSSALKAFQDGKLGTTLGDHAASTLLGGFKSAIGMSSPEITESLTKATESMAGMTYAKGVQWAVTSRIEGFQQAFRLVQGTGVTVDLIDKLDLAGVPPPGFDRLKSALSTGSG